MWSFNMIGIFIHINIILQYNYRIILSINNKTLLHHFDIENQTMKYLNEIIN